MDQKDLKPTLAEYKALIKQYQIPLPSEKQIQDFILMVREDHSWYKHLGEETSFGFAIDLHPKKYSRALNDKWGRKEEEYLEHFGHLNYFIYSPEDQHWVNFERKGQCLPVQLPIQAWTEECFARVDNHTMYLDEEQVPKFSEAIKNTLELLFEPEG